MSSKVITTGLQPTPNPRNDPAVIARLKEL